MTDDAPRSRAARRSAESALVRVVHHYGARPGFVVLGGLVPELLCAGSDYHHAGTTDIDVQVDLEIAYGSANAVRLEQALRNADFEPDDQYAWRWRADGPDARAVVKFELLADLDDQPAGAQIHFDGCETLGAANLRGTGYASRDVEVRLLAARIGDVECVVEVNVTGLAGFLLAKSAAARSRRMSKDWYDLAFVLLHNDAGGPIEAAEAVVAHFGDELTGLRTTLDDFRANFADPTAQGPQAYARQMLLDHSDVDRTTLLADAVVAVATFHDRLYGDG